MAGESPDRHHADTGTTPAQTEGKVTGMAETLGGDVVGDGDGGPAGTGGRIAARQRRTVGRGKRMGASGRAPAN